MSRFSNRKIFKNDSELYKEMAEERDVNYFRHHETARLRYPTAKEISEMNIVDHVWKSGDKFYKLAQEYYGDATLWWVIAWFNRTPTEAQAKLGSIISIPLPVQKVLKYLRNE